MSKKASTWLPIFPGFYNTVFESDFDNDLEYVKERIKETGETYTGELELVEKRFYDTDAETELYKEYKQDVTKQVTKLVEQWLVKNGFAKSVKLEGLYSPKEYNFYNDSISIEVVFNSRNVSKIKKYIKEHSTEWAEYLEKRYTSYDGFRSSYSNSPDSEDWNIDKNIDSNHQAGSILNFIMTNEGLDEMWMYYEVENRVSINVEKLREEVKEEYHTED